MSCWHRLEYFSPTTLPKSRKIELIDQNKELPWQKTKLTLEQNRVRIYTLYLGVFQAKELLHFVEKLLKKSTNDVNLPDDQFCYASIQLDGDGKFIENTLGISTLPWAMKKLSNNQLLKEGWNEGFNSLRQELLEKLDDHLFELIEDDEENRRVPISMDFNGLIDIQDQIIESTGWGEDLEVKMFYKWKERDLTKPEKQLGKVIAQAELLNSFYVDDLEWVADAVNKKDEGNALRKYLKGATDEEIEKDDLRKSPDKIQEFMKPNLYPDGCWPSKHQPSLMQQFVINVSLNKMLKSKGDLELFSVNGPPGTGKTTLLKDVIAFNLVERAKIMATYKNPSEAFKVAGKINNDSDFTYKIFSPVEALSEFGMVIASSNNGAVENISKELPTLDQVESFEEEIGYFREVANKVDPNLWGILSAVLGKKSNRTEFINKYWVRYEDETYKKVGLQKYFLDFDTSDLEPWFDLRKSFLNKLEEIKQEKERLTQMYHASFKEKEYLQSIISIDQKIGLVNNKIGDNSKDVEKQKNILNDLNNYKANLEKEIIQGEKLNPGFFARFFNTKQGKEYKAEKARLLKEIIKNRSDRNLVNQQISSLENNSHDLNLELDKLLASKGELVKSLGLIEKAKKELGDNYADEEFWGKLETKRVQMACPWYSRRLKELQTDLFILSLKVNQQFLVYANKDQNKIVRTISAFTDLLKGKMQGIGRSDAKALWDMFFLLVPVVSSTFASFRRQFIGLEKEDIPWLFIDEAGQAVPQSSVGAIYRSERVLVVGDPLQIEPVVTVPDILVQYIRESFELNKRNISEELSVQTFADRANPMGTFLSLDNGEQSWIGTQLRVHRRCQNPMFSIANRIAYNNTMFKGIPESRDESRLFFKTSFYHSVGSVSNRHFADSHALVVERLIKDAFAQFNKEPNIYVITPFKEISQELKNHIKKSMLFQYPEKTIDQSKALFGEWVEERIGTIHTFQGKQADSVILCLGLDERTKSSASWASQKPNILNVALTRAKYSFIAIGDENIWLKQPYFEQLKSLNQLVG